MGAFSWTGWVNLTKRHCECRDNTIRRKSPGYKNKIIETQPGSRSRRNCYGRLKWMKAASNCCLPVFRKLRTSNKSIFSQPTVEKQVAPFSFRSDRVFDGGRIIRYNASLLICEMDSKKGRSIAPASVYSNTYTQLADYDSEGGIPDAFILWSLCEYWRGSSWFVTSNLC